MLLCPRGPDHRRLMRGMRVLNARGSWIEALLWPVTRANHGWVIAVVHGSTRKAGLAAMYRHRRHVPARGSRGNRGEEMRSGYLQPGSREYFSGTPASHYETADGSRSSACVRMTCLRASARIRRNLNGGNALVGAPVVLQNRAATLCTAAIAVLEQTGSAEARRLSGKPFAAQNFPYKSGVGRSHGAGWHSGISGLADSGPDHGMITP